MQTPFGTPPPPRCRFWTYEYSRHFFFVFFAAWSVTTLQEVLREVNGEASEQK
jgi:hypothetical protein